MRPAPKFLETITPDPPDPDALDRLRRLAAHLLMASTELEAAEEQVRVLQQTVLELAQRQIPDAMDMARVDSVGLPELGHDVRLRPWVKAALPRDVDDRAQAVQWLVDHGHADLIKNELTIAFTRGEHNLAVSTAEGLRAQLPDKSVELSEDVHHMTLTAFVREQMGGGEALPLEMLGARVGRVAHITKREEK